LTVDSTYGSGSGSINVPAGGVLTITGGLTFDSGSIGGTGIVALTTGRVSNITRGTIIVGRVGWVDNGALTLGPSSDGPAAEPGPLTITGTQPLGKGTFANNGTIIQTCSIVNGPVNCSVLNAFGATYEIAGDGDLGNAAGLLTNRGTLV